MGKDKGENDATRGLDPVLAERLAGPATPFGKAQAAARAGAILLAPAAGAEAVPIACEVVPWRIGGALRVSVVVKASFAMLPADGGERGERAGAPVNAEPFRAADAHHRNQPLAHVVSANDRVPWKVAVDVTALGHAYPPGGAPAAEAEARFALRHEGRMLIDKAVRVVGDRDAPDAGPRPFTRMPVVYERAFGGVGTPANPAGCGGLGDDQPNILDPENVWRPAGFGPISSAWPLRHKLLGDLSRRVVEAPVIDLPAGFAFAYFQSAPRDQQLAELPADAVVVLRGFHAERAEVEVELPRARAVGAVYGLDDRDPDAGTLLRFRADTLHVDADRWIATISFRAAVDVASASLLAGLTVTAGVGLRGADPPVAARRPSAAAASLAEAPAASAASTSEAPAQVPVTASVAPRSATLDLGPAQGSGTTLPFGGVTATAGFPVEEAAPVIPAALPAPSSALAVASPEAPGVPMASLFHDLSKLRGAEGLVPRAKDAPLEPPKIDEQIALGRYAELCGILGEPRANLAATLESQGVGADVFHKAERHWRRALTAEAKRGGRALRDLFDETFVGSWEALRPDRFGPADYARLVAAERQGLLQVELGDIGLPGPLAMRLRRVWKKRVAAKGPAAEAVARALAAGG